MTKKHFEAIADILGTSKGKGEIEKKLVVYFQQVNPLFDASRFKQRVRKLEFPNAFK